MYQEMRELLYDNIYDPVECDKAAIPSDEMLEWFSDEFAEKLGATDSFKLYRYSSADYNNIRNFEKSKLNLAPIGSMNDVFEGLPSEDIDKLSPSEWKFIKDAAFIKCFSESHENPLMWAHYADSHAGICVEYDLKLLQNNEILKYIFPISYKRESCPLSISLKELALTLGEVIVANMNRGIGEIYRGDRERIRQTLSTTMVLSLLKGKEWEYENEWRIIVPYLKLFGLEGIEDGKGVNTQFKGRLIDFDCISAIYTGLRVRSEIKENIEEIVARINATRDNKNKVNMFNARIEARGQSIIFDKVE